MQYVPIQGGQMLENMRFQPYVVIFVPKHPGCVLMKEGEHFNHLALPSEKVKSGETCHIALRRMISDLTSSNMMYIPPPFLVDDTWIFYDDSHDPVHAIMYFFYILIHPEFLKDDLDQKLKWVDMKGINKGNCVAPHITAIQQRKSLLFISH